MSFRYYCDIPDEYVFSPAATLSELAVIVKTGRLTDEQRQRYEHSGGAGGGGNTAAGTNNGKPVGPKGNHGTAPVVAVHQPWCPWFTCCY
jgi:hypothetical protein